MALWGVRKVPWVSLYVWVCMCLCGVRVLTTPTEEKQPFLAGLFQVKNCFQNPEMVARLSSVSCRAVGRTGLSGRVADRP